jgi:hypothetical protein
LHRIEKHPLSTTVDNAVGRFTSFITRQKRNYRVAMTRSAANSFFFNLTAQYDSIYTLALGAGSVELGTVTAFGGMTLEGLRPLYYVRFAGYGLILFFVAAQLQDIRSARPTATDAGLVSGLKQLLGVSGRLRKWVMISSLTSLPMAMTPPFLQVFAHEVKGADQYVLGTIGTATILARLAFGIPFGRLADRIGRKKVIYLLTPLWYASQLLLIFSFNSLTLILAGALWTFYYINSGVTGAMTLELVPVEEMGKWSGLQGLFRGMVTIPAPILAGLIWRELGPAYVFVVPLVIDLVLRIPLLTTVPETLALDEDLHNQHA